MVPPGGLGRLCSSSWMARVPTAAANAANFNRQVLEHLLQKNVPWLVTIQHVGQRARPLPIFGSPTGMFAVQDTLALPLGSTRPPLYLAPT